VVSSCSLFVPIPLYVDGTEGQNLWKFGIELFFCDVIGNLFFSMDKIPSAAVLFVLVPLYVDGTEGNIFRSLEVELHLPCRDWASVFINGQRLRRN